MSSLLIIGGNGLIGRAAHITAERMGWAVTSIARRADSGVIACASDRALASLVGATGWGAVLDLRAYDEQSTLVVTQALAPSSAYVLVSSIYAYCHPQTHPERDLGRVQECSELTPTGTYGCGKVQAEQTALSSSIESVYVVRLPFVFGVGDRTGRTEALWRFALASVDEQVESFEIGLVSSTVVAQKLTSLLDRHCPEHQVLNVDSGSNWSMRHHLIAAREAFRREGVQSSAADCPLEIGRDFSLDSSALHKLLEAGVDDDLGRQWRDIARAW